jgi:hypothetical protein
VLGAGTAFGNLNYCGKTELVGGGYAGCFGDVRDDNRDFYAREPAFEYVLCDGEEVGAAAGKQDAET